MIPRPTRFALAATLAGVALAPTASAQAADGGFTCSARAVGGAVLGQALPLGGLAGGDGACRDTDAATALPVLLGRGAATAQTRSYGAGRQAVATADVADLALGSLDGLTGLLPAAALPAGLGAVKVPLPALPVSVPVVPTVPTLPALPAGGLPGLGGVVPAPSTLPVVGSVLPAGTTLPREITLDLRRAVAALVPQRLLPQLDVLRVGAAQTRASASCTGAAPVLEGDSQLAGVKVLGQDVGLASAVDKAVGLLPAGRLPLSGIDLSKVALPAGLSFDMPVVGPILTQAVQGVLAGLPPLDLDAVAARVQVTPGSQERTGDALVQRGPRVTVSALGRELVDVTLGEARVGAEGVTCAPPASAPAAPAPASQLAIACANKKVTLVDVAMHDGHVSLLGAAGAQDIGRTVSIVFAATGKVVATGVVRPDGFFRAQAPLPDKAVRGTNAARYTAVLDGSKSLALKLTRRMRISKLNHRGDKVLITGKIAGPLVPGQEIVIRRKVSCTQDVVAKRFTPTKAGTWKVWLDAPTEGQAAAYRATTQVLGSDESTRKFPTFTLPGYVSL